MKQRKKYKSKIVGIVDKNFCKKNNINKYANVKIEQSIGLIYHVQKHMNDFSSVDSFNHTMLNISQVIEKPLAMQYDESKKSIKYFKKLQEHVCVVVNLTDDSAFVATLYPVNKKTIDKIKQ